MSFVGKRLRGLASLTMLTLLVGFAGQPQAQGYDPSILVKKGDTITGKLLTGQFFDAGLTDRVVLSR